MFKFGIHRQIVEDSPVKLLFRPGGKEKARQRTLSDSELAAFLKDPTACTRFERLEHVIKVLLLTGARRGELVAAKWSDVDYTARTWTIRAEVTKTARTRITPLSDWVVEEFRALESLANRSRYVLPSSDGREAVNAKQLTRSVAKCLKRFEKRGISAFTLHDLRRTCRTGLARLKVDPHIAERVLGHSLGKIADTYDTHAYLDEQRKALDKWAEHLRSIAGT
jgi:integrase